MDLEDIKHVGQVSTIMRLLTSEDSDLSSCFDKNFEKALDNSNPLKQILLSTHAEEVNKGKIKDQLPLEHTFGFCKTFKKFTKNLGFHVTFKMIDHQDIIFTTIATDINVTINSLSLYVPKLTPNSKTQVMFDESIMNNYTITFDSWYTEQKISNNGRELQVDKGSARKINSPKYLIVTFQSNDSVGSIHKANSPAVFNTNHFTKYFVEIDDVLYSKDGVLTNFAENSYLYQYSDLK